MNRSLNANSLYPIVNDLDHEDEDGCSAEEDVPALAMGCCDFSSLVPDMLQPLLERPATESPEEESIPQERNPSNHQRDVPEEFEVTLSVPRSTNFHDAYVLTRQIYQGTNSTIWEVIHRISETKYAAKIFDRRVLGPREDEAARREIAMLMLLGDAPTGTVHMLEAYEEATHFYLVMDLVDACNLHSRVVQKQRFSEKEARQVARSLLEGVRYLHHQDICHRNLKPENILLSRDERDVKIAGFGMSAALPYSNGSRGLLDDAGRPLTLLLKSKTTTFPTTLRRTCGVWV